MTTLRTRRRLVPGSLVHVEGVRYRVQASAYMETARDSELGRSIHELVPAAPGWRRARPTKTLDGWPVFAWDPDLCAWWTTDARDFEDAESIQIHLEREAVHHRAALP